MTVVYTEGLATAQDLSGGFFWRILTLWRGSIYKVIWPNMLLYVACYFLLSLSYRTMMTDDQRHNFENMTWYFRRNVEKIQVPFFLGFFVTEIYNRWWQQFYTLPWPDSCAISIGGNMTGVNRNERNMRRQIIRYVVLSFTFLMRTISPPVTDRFKRRTKLIDHGMLTDDELMEMRRLGLEDEYRPHYVVALQWSAMLAAKARLDDSMPSEEQLQQYLDTIVKFSEALNVANVYNWINLPLACTQLVTMVVYTYYGAQLVAEQFLNPKTDCIHQDDDNYVPLYLFTQFFFFMGWLKTAEVLINPFGEDDDDLDINWLIDRNYEMTFVADDHIFSDQPKRLFDWYWSQTFDDEIPRAGDPGEMTETQRRRKDEEQVEHLVGQEEDDKSNIKQAKVEVGADRRKREVVEGHSDLKSPTEKEESELPSFPVQDLYEFSDMDEDEDQISIPGHSLLKLTRSLIGSIAQHVGLIQSVRKTSIERQSASTNVDIQHLEMIAGLSDADIDSILDLANEKESYDNEDVHITIADAAEYFNDTLDSGSGTDFEIEPRDEEVFDNISQTQSTVTAKVEVHDEPGIVPIHTN